MDIRTIKSKILLSATALALWVFTGCYYDVEDELYPSSDISNCDTSNVTYSKDVAPVLSGSCLSCHSGASPSGGIALDNYSAVAVQANNGKLMGSIIHAQGFSAMPPNGTKLSDCTIKKIQVWINNGVLND